MTSTRAGKKWTTAEVLSLEREFDLLQMPLEEIAARHNRSVEAIAFKLQAEGYNLSLDKMFFAEKKKSPAVQLKIDTEVDSDADSSSDYNDDVSEYSDDCVECSLNDLTDRVWSLETSVGEISNMVKQMFDQMSSQKKSKKLAPLRKSIHL